MADTKTFGEPADPDPAILPHEDNGWDWSDLPELEAGDFGYVRHGQTFWNERNLMQGHSNHKHTCLTPAGRAQAVMAGRILKRAGIRHFVSSGLWRAQQTAEIIWSIAGGTWRADEDLNERCFGKLEGLTMPQVVEEVGALSVKDFEDNFHHYLPPCAENNPTVLRRVIPALNRWRKLYKGEKVAFISHGAVFRVLGEHLLKERVRSKNGVPFDFLSPEEAGWVIREMGER